jgi:hypothetical protein
MFLNYISPLVFLISLSIGLFVVYLTSSSPTVIYVYPTPNNVDRLQFKDKANNCYEFSYEEVNCPKDKSQISKIPIQN